MPELPEVETVCKGLRRHLIGRTIVNITVWQWDVIRSCEGGKDQFSHRLSQKRIKEIKRRGKYIIFVLNSGFLVCHLRMSGKLFVVSSSEKRKKHEHVSFDLDDQNKLIYVDTRRFGGFSYSAEDPSMKPPLSELGIEPLSEAFTQDYLKESCRHRKRPIKTQLLDQHIISGIGNIYADEILFRAGIRPRKRADRLNKKECAKVVEVTKSVLKEAIEKGGSSIRDYVDSDHQKGGYQLEHQVYGRAGQPCRQCGTILKAVRVGGRMSVYCPKCQKS